VDWRFREGDQGRWGVSLVEAGHVWQQKRQAATFGYEGAQETTGYVQGMVKYLIF
jgi:hypothetical protein